METHTGQSIDSAGLNTFTLQFVNFISWEGEREFVVVS